MNNDKRNISYIKIKNYIKFRKKGVRFDLHPNLERNADLRDDIRFLKLFAYSTLERLQSEVRCERYDRDLPLQIRTFNESSFWSFLYSDEWQDCSSLRVCEGELLDQFVENLYLLSDAGYLNTHKVGRFDTCQIPCYQTVLKEDNNVITLNTEDVKITFTYYGVDRAVSSQLDSASSMTSSTLVTTSQVPRTDSPGFSSNRPVSPPSREHSLKTDSSSATSFTLVPKKSFLSQGKHSEGSFVKSKHSLDLTAVSHSDSVVSLLAKALTTCGPLDMASKLITNGRLVDGKTGSNTTSKTSIQPKPSYESMVNSIIRFIDDRGEDGYEQGDGGSTTWRWQQLTTRTPSKSQLSIVPFRPVDTKEHVVISEEELAGGYQAKGLVHNAAEPKVLAYRGSKSRALVDRDAMEDTEQSHWRSPNKRCLSAGGRDKVASRKVHGDRAALLYNIGTINGSVRAHQQQVVSQPAKPEGHSQGQTLADLNSEPDNLASHGEQQPPCPTGDRAAPPLNKNSLNLKYSIENFRLLVRRKKRRPMATDTMDSLKRKHIEGFLESRLPYTIHGLRPEMNTKCRRIRLFDETNKQLVRGKDKRERTEVLGDVENPTQLFPQTDIADFRGRLLRAAQTFLFRKEQVTRGKGRGTITSVTINRVIPCHYGNPQLEMSLMGSKLTV